MLLVTVGKLCICKVSFPEKWLARSFLEVSDCFKTYMFSVLGPLSDSVCDREKKKIQREFVHFKRMKIEAQEKPFLRCGKRKRKGKIKKERGREKREISLA